MLLLGIQRLFPTPLACCADEDERNSCMGVGEMVDDVDPSQLDDRLLMSPANMYVNSSLRPSIRASTRHFCLGCRSQTVVSQPQIEALNCVLWCQLQRCAAACQNIPWRIPLVPRVCGGGAGALLPALSSGTPQIRECLTSAVLDQHYYNRDGFQPNQQTTIRDHCEFDV